MAGQRRCDAEVMLKLLLVTHVELLKDSLKIQEQIFQPLKLDPFFRISEESNAEQGVTKDPSKAGAFIFFGSCTFPINAGVEGESDDDAPQGQHVPDRARGDLQAAQA